MTDLSSYKLLAVLLLFLLPPASQGEIYKWVDDKGKVHFGDRPPDPESAQTVEVNTTPASTNTGNEPIDTQKLLNSYMQKRNEADAEKQQEEQLKQQNKPICDAAKNKLKRLNDGVRFFDRDQDGNVRIFDDQKRDSEMKKLQGYIQKNC